MNGSSLELKIKVDNDHVAAIVTRLTLIGRQIHVIQIQDTSLHNTSLVGISILVIIDLANRKTTKETNESKSN